MILVVNKDSNINNKLNQIAVILICMWIAIPILRVKLGVIFLFFLFIVWLITTDLKWLTQKLSWDLIFIIIFFITFVPYLVSGNLQYGLIGSKGILVNFPIFFVGIFINHYYMYYKEDYKTLGKIALFSLFFYTIGSLQTYFGLLKYPLAARELAGAIDNNPGLTQLYSELGIGGFGHIYSATFLLIVALFPILRARLFPVKNKIIIFISAISILLMLLRASYATSLMILFFGLILILVVKNRFTFIFLIIMSTILCLLIPQTAIGDFLLSIANLFKDNNILNQKFVDLAQFILNNSTEGQTGTRINLYLSSLQTFLSNPLFGIYGPFGNSTNAKVGGHSGWFDLLAYYGLFTAIPLFLTLFYNYRKHRQFYKRTQFSSFVITIYLLFIIFGFINPILYVYEIGFVLFCVVPAIPFISYAFKLKDTENLTLERGN